MQCLQNILSSQMLYVYLYQPCFSFFTTRVYFKGDISLSQRPINSPYFSHLWAHFFRLLLAVLTSITSCCHSSLTLMSSWPSWKLLHLKRTTCDPGTGVVFCECLFVFAEGCVTPFALFFTLTLPSLKSRNIWALEISCFQIWMSWSLGSYTAKHIACQ